MSWKYRPELDGLRSLAVALVIVFHAGVVGWSNAFIGVDLFFVLSGFLVTNVVLSEVDATGRLRVGHFYARRVRRLLPAAVLTVVTVSGLFVLVASQPERLDMVRQAQAALLYVANWQFLADQGDYFAADIAESPFLHFWSLSVEEQYYIAFPLLVVLMLKLAPQRQRILMAVLGTLTVGSLASQLYWAQVDPGRAFYATDARFFQLLAGALAAMALREFTRRRDPASGVPAWPVAGSVLAVVGLGGVLVASSSLLVTSVSVRNVVATGVSLALIVGLYAAPRSLIGRLFSLPWLTWLGKISYGIYLWHWPTILVLERTFDVRPLGIALMAAVLATALAALSYELVETPIRRGKLLDGFRWRTVAGGVTVSVIAAVAVVGPVLHSSRTPVLLAGGPADAEAAQAVTGGDAELRAKLEAPVPKGLDWERIAKDRGPSDRWCTPEDVAECLWVDGDGLHVVLVGDSQARMLAPAFKRAAKQHGFRVSLSVVSSCPWQHDVYNGGASRERRERCLEARRDFYAETLPAMEADLVVFVSLARSEGWDGRLLDYDDNPLDLPGDFARQTERTVAMVEEAGAKSILVKSVMGTDGWDVAGWDPLDCLARARIQGDCVVTPPQQRPVADGFYDTAASLSESAATIDINPLTCPTQPVCLPVVDGRVVWRNKNHLTGDVTRHLSERIWGLVVETGLVQ